MVQPRKTWKEVIRRDLKEGKFTKELAKDKNAWKYLLSKYMLDLGEGVHRLNLLCGANLQDDELGIAMREIDSDDAENMYKHAKNVSKKYFGKSAITGK